MTTTDHTTDVADHVMALLGDVHGRRVLDLGCGDGQVAGEIVTRGGRYVGLAAADHLADGARHPSADVRVTDLDRYWGTDLGVFDLAVSAVALQHVRNLARLLETLHHHVVSGGWFVFFVDHPATTAGDTGYFAEGERRGSPMWAGRTLLHRSLETYLRELRYCGFRVDEFSEGKPGEVGFHAPGLALSQITPRWAMFRCVRTP